MDAEHENPVEEIERLRRCVNDLVSVLALPAMWTGGEASQIVRTLLDVLPEMLHLDLVYVRVDDPTGAVPFEMVRMPQPQGLTDGAQEIGAMLKRCLGDDPKQWPSQLRTRLGDGDISMVPLRLGFQGEIGVIVVGSRRLDFPGRTEKLLLDVTANQALIALQEAKLRSGQKRVADELEQRVAQRTMELAAANAELGKEIAERGLAEEKLRREKSELRRSEARNAAILDSALDCIVTMDDQGCITEFNPAAERTFGYRRDEVVGKRLAEVMIPPSLREGHRRGFARYLATGEARVIGRRIELTAVRADGSEFPVELAITRIPLEGPPSFTGYLRDITERKMSEEKLRRSEAYLAEAQKLSLTGSFGWKVATDEHFWSVETFRIFEYDTSTKITLALILDRVYPQDIPLVREAIGLAAERENFDYECRLLMPGRSVKYVHIVAHRVSGRSDHREFVGAVMDISARRRAEAALRQAQADLAHVSRVTSLGELTASIAHELNQPLGSVVNNANACLSLLPDDAPQFNEIREALSEIIQGTDQASAVIARVRQFLKKAPSERTVLNLRDVIADVLALTRHDSAARQVKMRTELTEDMPSVQGDRVQLQQVLLNLVVNGMEAMHTTEESKRVLTIRGCREMLDGAPRCLLGVQDAGTGFKPEQLDQLFEAFYTTKPQGMGMGLAISRSIIEAHDGRLWAETNPGPGATFLLSLPAARSTHS
jgi:PAS domain S-box-containing protein